MYCIRNIKLATIFVYEGISIVKRMSKLHEVHVMNIQRAHNNQKILDADVHSSTCNIYMYSQARLQQYSNLTQLTD